MNADAPSSSELPLPEGVRDEFGDIPGELLLPVLSSLRLRMEGTGPRRTPSRGR